MRAVATRYGSELRVTALPPAGPARPVVPPQVVMEALRGREG